VRSGKLRHCQDVIMATFSWMNLRTDTSPINCRLKRRAMKARVYMCVCKREREERVHACVYIPYNSDLRHWTAINVINERELLTILILSRCNRNNKVFLHSHSVLSSLLLYRSLPICLSFFLFSSRSLLYSNAKLMARKSPKDILVSRIFRDVALTTNLRISLQVMKTITNYSFDFRQI